MPPKETKKITVVALLEVTSSLGTEKIRSFDAAWHRGLALPTPVSISFLDFVHID